MIDAETGKILPEDHPAMVKIMEVWGKTTRPEREAFHNVTCLNSRNPEDLRKVKGILDRFENS
jgi:hypothetical protein